MTLKAIFNPLVLLLALAMVAVAIAGFVLVPAEAILPVHWGPTGQADGFLPRDGALLMPLAIAASLLAIFVAVGRFAPPERLDPARYLLKAGLPAMLSLFLAIQAATVLIGLGVAIDMIRVIALAIGVLLIALGNAMPKSQPNALAGIRLPWTMSDPANWLATHRLTGLLTVLAGACLLILAIVVGDPVALLACIIAAIVLPLLVGVAYSYRLARR